jgi:tellurite resistance protein TehA-like permease
MDGAGFIFGLIIAAIIGVLIAKDANSRGMNGAGWGIFTFLVCIVAVPIYLIVRKPVKKF